MTAGDVRPSVEGRHRECMVLPIFVIGWQKKGYITSRFSTAILICPCPRAGACNLPFEKKTGCHYITRKWPANGLQLVYGDISLPGWRGPASVPSLLVFTHGWHGHRPAAVAPVVPLPPPLCPFSDPALGFTLTDSSGQTQPDPENEEHKLSALKDPILVRHSVGPLSQLYSSHN